MSLFVQVGRGTPSFLSSPYLPAAPSDVGKPPTVPAWEGPALWTSTPAPLLPRSRLVSGPAGRETIPKGLSALGLPDRAVCTGMFTLLEHAQQENTPTDLRIQGISIFSLFLDSGPLSHTNSNQQASHRAYPQAHRSYREALCNSEFSRLVTWLRKSQPISLLPPLPLAKDSGLTGRALACVSNFFYFFLLFQKAVAEIKVRIASCEILRQWKRGRKDLMGLEHQGAGKPQPGSQRRQDQHKPSRPAGSRGSCLGPPPSISSQLRVPLLPRHRQGYRGVAWRNKSRREDAGWRVRRPPSRLPTLAKPLLSGHQVLPLKTRA